MIVVRKLLLESALGEKVIPNGWIVWIADTQIDCFNFFIFVNGQSRWWQVAQYMYNLHRSGTILMCLSTVKFHPTNLSINKLQLSTSKRTGNSNLNKSYFSPPWMWAACCSCIRLGIPWVNRITLDIFNSINNKKWEKSTVLIRYLKYFLAWLDLTHLRSAQ